MQAVATQLASLEAADDSFAGFMDAETATFASRIRRLMRSKVEELQSSMPGQDSGMPLCRMLELTCSDHSANCTNIQQSLDVLSSWPEQ